MKKRFLGKVYTFKLQGRKSNISGFVLSYNDDWTLVKRCADYTFDGYTIFKNENVEFELGEFEKRITKILKLKNEYPPKLPKIKIDSLDDILKSISNKYKLIQLDFKDGESFDVVTYLGKSDSNYLFDELTTNAKWRYKLKLSEKECRVISFDNDYLNSLKLITRFRKSHMVIR